METLLFCAVLLVLLTVLLQSPTDHHIDLFADRYDVPVTTNNAALLRSYIWWARMFRLGGFAVVVVVVAFVEKFGSIDIGGPVSLFTLAGGYAGGAVFGELLRPRPDGRSAKASLDPRTSATYVRGWLVGCVIAIGVLVAVAVLMTIVIDPSGSYAPSALTVRQAIVVGSAALIVVGCGLFAGNSMARRPVVTSPGDRAAVDHAVRSASVIAALGGALMFGGVALARLATDAALIDGAMGPVVRWIDNVLALTSLAAILSGFFAVWKSIPRFGRSAPQHDRVRAPS